MGAMVVVVAGIVVEVVVVVTGALVEVVVAGTSGGVAFTPVSPTRFLRRNASHSLTG